MLQSLQMAYGLLEPADRARIARLFPWMVLSSSSDVVTVVLAASFFRFLAEPSALGAGWLGGLGLERAQLMIAISLGMLAVVIVTNLANIYALYRVNRFGFDQVIALSERTLAAYLQQPYAWFLMQNSAALRQRALVETQRVVVVMCVQTLQAAARSIGSLLIVLWLLYNDPLLTALLAVFIGSAYGSMYLGVRRRMVQYGKVRHASDQQRHRAADESLMGIKEIKLHGLEGEALARYRTPSLRFAHALAWSSTLQGMTKPMLEMVGVGGMVLVAIVFQLTDRPLAGVLALVGTYAIAAYRLLPIFQTLFAIAMRIRLESYALERIVADIGAAPAPLQLTDTVPLRFERALQLDAVGFRYDGTDAPVLRGLSLELPRGSWTALVGTTGAGKTTLVDLLMGLLEVSEGVIRVDDQPLDTPERRVRWQRNIGYVPQAMFMSDSTIAHNIAFGEREPDLERVKRAAHLAAIGAFIEDELPQGYDTPIGERGLRLSGGQRQRIGIARALYRDPDLLVLDEATSALDNRTEAHVIDALRTHYAETTVVMVAHRLSTTRHCDQIVLLDRGRVLARGSYDELLANSPVFREMVEASRDEPASSSTPAPPPEPPCEPMPGSSTSTGP